MLSTRCDAPELDAVAAVPLVNRPETVAGPLT